MRFWFFYLYIAPHILLAAAVVLFLRRRLRAQFPFFFAFMLFELTYFIVGTATYVHALSDPVHLSYQYQWVVASGLAVGTMFEFGVLYELCDRLLLSGLRSLDSVRATLRWVAGILLLAASVVSAWLTKADLARVTAVFQTLNFSANLIKIGLLLALVLLTRILGISWRSLASGIALGFGVAATAEVSASALMAQLGHPGYGAADFIRMAAFHVCVLVWLVYILLPEKRPTLSGGDLQVSDLETHLQELQRMVRR